MAVVTLPSFLGAAIAAEADRIPRAEVAQAAQRLSEAYRRRSATLAMNDAWRTAYLAARLPATYAAVLTALQKSVRVIDSDRIRSCLDVGAGPGTASLAARDAAPSITAFAQLERDSGWSPVANRLAQSAGINATRVHGDIAAKAMEPHDLVVAAYALNEIPGPALDAVIKRLWDATRTALLVVEPGTPDGFAVVRRVRELCLELGAHAAAPCTHDATCPMSKQDWCHRVVRLERSALHRQLKDARLAVEDEKFSFVALTRDPPQRLAPGRIVRRPIRAGGHVHLDLCSADGLTRSTITRADRTAYKDARDAAWGDLWPTSPDGGEAD